MARGKKHSPEKVVNLLRQIEVAVTNGKTTAVAYFQLDNGGMVHLTARSRCLTSRTRRNSRQLSPPGLKWITSPHLEGSCDRVLPVQTRKWRSSERSWPPRTSSRPRDIQSGRAT